MDKSTAFMRQLQKNLFDVAFNCWGDFFTEVSDTLQVMCSDKCLLSYLLARWNQVNFTLNNHRVCLLLTVFKRISIYQALCFFLRKNSASYYY